MILSDLQHTIGATASFEGVGLHTGEHAQLRILPAEPNTGYLFVRIRFGRFARNRRALLPMSAKREGAPPFSLARPRFTPPNTCSLRLYAAGIDNARLELNGPEVPILDGSAQPFMDAITAAGSEQQDAPRKTFRVRNNLSFRDDNGVEMLVVPAEAGEFKVTVMVDYESPVLGTQHARLDQISDFGKDIASSRTFVFPQRSGVSGRSRPHQRRGHRQCGGVGRARLRRR